jgi:hypothetical protein
MPVLSIPRLNERNIAGICLVELVPIDLVIDIPPVINGTVTGQVTLQPDAQWSSFALEENNGRFTEKWSLQNGDIITESVLSGNIPKDRPWVLPILWSLKAQRFLVAFRSQNRTRYLMGNLHSPVMANVTDRIIGEADGSDSARNELRLAFTLRDRFPVPFHRV